MMTTYYRADKRDFEIDERIQSANEFYLLNPDGSEDVEHIFEEFRPTEKPKRKGALYLFLDETAAKKHWSKMTDGKLYVVEPSTEETPHISDMHYVNEAFQKRNSHEEVATLANKYWNEDRSDTPILEVLVSSAIVKKVLSKDQTERRAYFKSWAIAKSDSPECLPNSSFL